MDEQQGLPPDGDEVGVGPTREREQFDWTETKPSTAVVDLVSSALGVASTDVEPLYYAVDPEALDRVVADPVTERDASAVEVSFTFADRRVTVEGAGAVVVDPVDVG